MPHANLSPRLNEIVDNQFSYRNMVLGDRLAIEAIDARTRTMALCHLQVVGFRPCEKIGHAPIFAGGGRFSFIGEDRRTPTRFRRGTLMLGGVSATHVPDFVLSMVGFGGIGLGRDYSLEYIGGEDRFAYIHALRGIMRRPQPRGWTAPTEEVAAYLRSVEEVERRSAEAHVRRQIRLRRAMVVSTANSTYELGEADADGKRTLTKRGSDVVHQGQLIALRKGRGMEFDSFTVKQTMHTSTVERIDPDPDVD